MSVVDANGVITSAGYFCVFKTSKAVALVPRCCLVQHVCAAIDYQKDQTQRSPPRGEFPKSRTARDHQSVPGQVTIASRQVD